MIKLYKSHKTRICAKCNYKILPNEEYGYKMDWNAGVETEQTLSHDIIVCSKCANEWNRKGNLWGK